MIKSNYERLLREEKDRKLAQTIQLNDQSNLINNNSEPQKEKTKSAPIQNQLVTREEMQNCMAVAVTAAANIILEKNKYYQNRAIPQMFSVLYILKLVSV